MLFFAKPFLYVAVYAVAARLWRDVVPPRWWRWLGAGLARYALGWVVMLPLGAMLFTRGDVPETPLAYVAYFVARFAVWAVVAKLFFRAVSWQRIAALALAGTLLNAAVDAATFDDGLRDAYNIRICERAPGAAPQGA